MTPHRHANPQPTPTIAVVGALGFDRIHTADGKVFNDLGGSAIYAALAASFLARPVLLSRVGRDFSPQNRQLLTDHEVDLNYLQYDPQQLSFFWSAAYSADGNSRQTLTMSQAAFAGFSPQWPKGLTPDAIQMGSIPPRFQLDLLHSLKITCPQHNTCPFAFDTFPHWIEDFPDEVRQLCQQATVISLNEEEACLLTGHRDPLAAAHHLFRQFQPEVFLLKQGSRGVVCLSAYPPFHLPAASMEHTPEPTGAGDSFIAAFLSHWNPHATNQQHALRAAAAFASAVAAATVRRPGIEGLRSARREDLHKLAAALGPQCRLI